MSTLFDALDLARSRTLFGYGSRTLGYFVRPSWPTFRSQFGFVSCFLRKPSGPCDDSFYAGNLWPCRDSRCRAVLGPLDVVGGEGTTFLETYRCCYVCGALTSSSTKGYFHKLTVISGQLSIGWCVKESYWKNRPSSRCGYWQWGIHSRCMQRVPRSGVWFIWLPFTHKI